MTGKNQRLWVRGLKPLGLIWLLGAIVDRLWFAIDHSVPSWDQADYLTGALNYQQALRTAQWFSADWWTQLWQLSSKIPPLVYISTTPFLNLFEGGFDQSTLVNLLYSAVLLGSVYALGVCLFSVSVGLWAAGLCLLMPGLYRVRLDYLLDYPLAAMVTLCFACLTLWRQNPGKSEIKAIDERSPKTSSLPAETLTDRLILMARWLYYYCRCYLLPIFNRLDWLLAIAFGITLGLAFMVKQPALLFLLVPIAWAGFEVLGQRAWIRVAQWLLALLVALFIFLPWYRTNWLLILSSSKRATIDSAIAEGDPSLLSLDAWTFYLRYLPAMVSLPILLLGLAGFLFFWRRSRVCSQLSDREDYAPKTKNYRQQTYEASRRSLGWLLLFCVSGYLLSSLNINKDVRYVVPYLPVLAVMLAYGWTLLPKHWKPVRWGAIGLAIVLMAYNILPLKPNIGLRNPLAYHPAYLGAAYPHAEVVAEVIKAEPYLRSTIGVLPSTPQINQHNVNYYGNLRDFQVYGRQVGTRLKQVEQDAQSLSWFLTKTGNQGSIRKQDAQTAIAQTVEQSGDFAIHKTWKLPDDSTLQLYKRRVPLLEVSPLIGVGREQPLEKSPSKIPTISLDQVILPDQAPPGKPIPVTYRWSGNWDTLKNGLVLLTWRRQDAVKGKSDRWLHDHAIGMGSLALSSPATKASAYQVVERMAMLPPATTAPGIYTLDVTYLHRQSGRKVSFAVPKVSFRINPAAAASPAPELDFNTQLRSLGSTLPQGMKAMDAAFTEIGRINQYDATQDYVDQTRQAMEFRLQQEPKNLNFAYTLALANILKRRVEPAIASLQKVIQLDPKNPNAYAYLAFVELYDFRAREAQAALKPALKLAPKSPEIQALNGVASLMRGNLVQAWQHGQKYFALSGEKRG